MKQKVCCCFLLSFSCNQLNEVYQAFMCKCSMLLLPSIFVLLLFLFCLCVPTEQGLVASKAEEGRGGQESIRSQASGRGSHDYPSQEGLQQGGEQQGGPQGVLHGEEHQQQVSCQILMWIKQTNKTKKLLNRTRNCCLTGRLN